ncbi:MAG TPA: transposase [Lacunisphaera sp.]|nr:transposase [Lacunisphaera sp.]
MHLPHLQPFKKQPLLFFTACTAERKQLLNSNVAKEILETVWTNAATLDGWFVGQYLLMPDHVHFFAQPSYDAKPLAHWVKSWKSISSRRIAKECRTITPIWQADYFDHFLRSADSYRQKWEYVQNNPVRKGLCLRSSDWPYQGTIHELRFGIAG